MNAIAHIIEHHTWLAIGISLFIYFCFSNAVGAMEAPVAGDSHTYVFWYRFLHGFAGNIKYALRTRAPEFLQPDADEQKQRQGG
jgi:hypothetical protein